MENLETENRAETFLRLLPSTDALLQTATARELLSQLGAKQLTTLARAAIAALRREAINANGATANFSRDELLAEAERRLAQFRQSEQSDSLQKVVNATGVIVHTNLGRAPLSENARAAIFEKAAGYCNLEYDLETGRRGRRGSRAEKLLAELTGAEDALIVNNCAAAAFLVLTVLATGGEVVISRGELVEIGGDFRVPDVLTQSGATLKEVGTTNRTKISDYERAIGENTKMILRVHPSNYRIVGFTATPDLAELAELAHKKNLILFEDAGSGAMFDLAKFGLTGEPVIQTSLAAGADVVTFSGDKLLGGVQSGLIAGKAEVVEKLRKHPLYRALRVDKLIYAATEATLEAFRRETALAEIPVLKMLSAPAEELEARTFKFAESLREKIGESSALKFAVVKGNSVVGGGSAPGAQPTTTLLALQHEKMSAARLEENLRLKSTPPIIARILEDKVLIDLRTVAAAEETEILEVLAVIG